jgi:hypothetical protein
LKTGEMATSVLTSMCHNRYGHFCVANFSQTPSYNLGWLIDTMDL